ncbi:MAG: aldo/keto reductase [Deltaproteobacteria bacterium]|jgi:aryl-alcohol dehydrogenase-like predicted oxidoreductase|nr:aldo/keto reductase [Deltaproteobacteria bacterium]
MEKIRLGRTNLLVTRPAFGALPIQRLSVEEAGRILSRAVDAGVNYIDTARSYTDSEEKIGAALFSRRSSLVISTKTQGKTGEKILEDLETSLRNLRTDYVDILQLHNANHVPLPGDGSGSYEALLRARESGKIRFIGITNHSIDSAVKAARTGLYDTLQFPFSLLAAGRELELPGLCKELDLGFIAMKALGGGLINDIPAAVAFIHKHENVVPIWGIQKMEELEEFLALASSPPLWDRSMEKRAEERRRELGASFCRGCGYCLPCPTEIDIPLVARILILLKRAPASFTLNPAARAKLKTALECIGCGACKSRCPYGLDTPELVRINAEGYAAYLRTL